ncbi:hypothetical protein PISL3812_09205 [Talaromyces islandicus]|uniref:Uncharacterized protein n=1 Tax=Talaromyces islandicus TaxID=28573 RepID=A0A0U1M9A5_TALIS|nr:hypothetical protein PISL3812_09205 [Talaromyces islandicus]
MDYLPARHLLPLTGVSRHFCAIIVQVLERRLLWVASLESDSWTLEVYLIQVGLEEDYNHASFNCQYIDTVGLVDSQDESLSVAQRLARLPNLYARYKPQQPAPVGSPSSSSTAEASGKNPGDMVQNRVSVLFDLEEENVGLSCCFNYYCPKDMQGMGDIVMLEGDEDCALLSRDWLNERAGRHISGADDDDKDDFVWFDAKEKNISVKFRVERKGHENKEETPSGTCNYELLIEEIRIRPVHILLMRNLHFGPSSRENIPLNP